MEFTRIVFPHIKKSRTQTTDHLYSPKARKDWEDLKQYADIIETKATKPEEFREECKNGALDGIVAIFRTFLSAEVTGIFDKELVSVLPKSLKFICHNGMSIPTASLSATYRYYNALS